LVLTFPAPNSLPCADGAVKNLLTHSSSNYILSYIHFAHQWHVNIKGFTVSV